MSITKLKRKRQALSLQPTHEHLLSCMYVTFFSEVEKIAHSRENDVVQMRRKIDSLVKIDLV